MKVAKTYRKDCALYWDLYIICNVLFLYLINCVTTKNELIGMFVSLGSEVAEGSILSGIIVRVPRTLCRVPRTIGRVPRTIVRVSRTIALIQPNLVPRICLTDRSDMSDGLRLDNLS
jgi:hypothetical protein